ncbi:hypothetical protein GCM10028821_33450 [Hymenobacter jeollabukensis]
MLSLLSARPLLAQNPSNEFDMARRVLAPGGSNGRPFHYGLAVDAWGNAYVCGTYGGEVFFDGASSGVGRADAYLAKIGPTGTPRWIKYLRTGGTFAGNAASLAVDAAGTVYLAGSYSAAPFQLSNTISLPNAGRQDVFVAHFDSAGNVLAAARAGGPADDAATRLALDAEGNVYVTGQFGASVAFGSTTLSSIGDQDNFVARLDPNGAWHWAQRIGSPALDYASALAVNEQGQVFASGGFNAAVTQLGPFTAPATSHYLVRLSAATGAFQRAYSLGNGTLLNSSRASVGDLATDAAGNCYVGGSVLGSVTLGTSTLVNPATNISLDDAFVAKLDTAGQWQWARVVATGMLGEYCTGLKVDRRGNIYLGGQFRSYTAQFGPFVLTSVQSFDLFVGKLNAAGQWQWVVKGQGSSTDYCAGLALGPYATPYIGGDYFSTSLLLEPHLLPGDPNQVASTYVARMLPNDLRITGDSVICTSGGSVQLTARTFAPNSGISYQWSTGATTASINVTQPGTYSVTAWLRTGTRLTEQFRVRSVPAPTVQISGATTPLCPGTPRQLTAVAPGAGAFRWSTGATTASITVTQPGTYSVTASFSATCTATAQTTLTGNALTISGRQQLCPGQSATLTAAASGSAVTGYRWNTGATTAALRVSQGGTYTVTATFADGCQLTRTHVVGPPVARVASVSGDTLLCPGTTLQLTALNPDALTYTWTTGETTPDIRIGRPGLYSVLLTYAGGCTSRDSLLVQAAPLAPAFSLGPDTTLCLEQPLVLRAPALSGPGLGYRWADGSTAPTLTVTEPGTYALTVTSLCDTRTVSRRVRYQSCLLLPNVITPNGDGRNDRFVVPGLTKGAWELSIFNRWGREVYRTVDYRHDWGAGVAPGVYFYLLRQGSVSYKGQLEVAPGGD